MGATEPVELMDRVGGWSKALVAFSGRTDLPWLRLLKPGYRHCFVSLSDGTQWVTFEPLSHCAEISLYPDSPQFDMKAFYRSQGLTVVETYLRPVPRQCAPTRPFTCVEGVKRVLGLHEPFIFTPYQLYKFLTCEEKCKLGKKSLDIGEHFMYT